MYFMPTDKKSYRMDFKQEIISFDEKTGEIQSLLIPDPDRYEYLTIDGKEGYQDKFDDIFIPIEELQKAAGQLEGTPIYSSRPKINDADAYIKSRIVEIKNFSDHKEESFEFKDNSEEFLESLKKDKMRFVILCIDLKG